MHTIYLMVQDGSLSFSWKAVFEPARKRKGEREDILLLLSLTSSCIIISTHVTVVRLNQRLQIAVKEAGKCSLVHTKTSIPMWIRGEDRLVNNFYSPSKASTCQTLLGYPCALTKRYDVPPSQSGLHSISQRRHSLFVILPLLYFHLLSLIIPHRM